MNGFQKFLLGCGLFFALLLLVPALIPVALFLVIVVGILCAVPVVAALLLVGLFLLDTRKPETFTGEVIVGEYYALNEAGKMEHNTKFYHNDENAICLDSESDQLKTLTENDGEIYHAELFRGRITGKLYCRRLRPAQ